MAGRRYPRNVFPYLDYDYVQRLSPKERAWLDTFSAEFYNGEFDTSPGATPLHRDEKQRAELGLIKWHRVRDIYERSPRAEVQDVTADAVDYSPAPEYLKTPEYREALNEFRAQIPSDRRRKPSYSAEFLASRSKVDAEAGLTTCGDVRLGSAREEQMAKNRTDRLKQTREVVFNIGVLIARSQVKGEEAFVVAQSLQWLEGQLSKIDEKLKAMGVSPPAPPTSNGGAQ